jgi:hypothetical protein
MASGRLDIFARTARARPGVDVEATEQIGRHLSHVEQAAGNLDRLLPDLPTD